MDLQNVIRRRRSIRDFDSESVSREILRDLIEIAVQAPSAMNQQPWSFYVIEDQTILRHVSTQAKAHMLAAAPEAAPMQLRQMLADPSFHIFYNAPALVLICGKRDDHWAIENCALAAQNLMLAAFDFGLGACWIGLAQSWLGTSEGLSLIGAANDCLPVAPIIVGHPKGAPPVVSRNPPDIHWIEPW